MNLPANFKPGQLVKASEWNEIARAVNRIWAMETDANFELIKGEPWRIRYKRASSIITTWFNDTTRRVYVWRADTWDYGSESPPLAFFVAGAFTTLNSTSTLRLAKVVKGSNGASARDTTFCEAVDFTGTTALLSKDKTNTSQLLVGSEGLNSYAGLSATNSHLINWTSAGNVGSFVGPSFPATPMVGLTAIGARYIFHDYTTLFACDSTGTVLFTHTSPVNMHSVVNDGSNVYLSMRRVFTGVPTGYDSDQYPDGVRKLSSNGFTDAAFDAAAGFGAGCCCFFATLPPKEIWDAGGTNLYTSASLEYPQSQDMTWNGGPFGDGASTAGILKVTTGGTLAGIGLGLDHVGPDGIETPTCDRAWVFCISPTADIWFGGGVTALRDSFSVTPTTDYQLYKYNETSGVATYFSGFNGTVYDCQYFSTRADAVTQQFIVVGAFTTYNGDTAERIVFIDQNGTRLSDLEWP